MMPLLMKKTQIFLAICIKQEDFRQNMRIHETGNNIKQYICELCDHKWSRRYDYENHLKTKKHEKIRQTTEKKTPMAAINDETVRSEKM
jgi:protein-arginine kinase activator protein McsA